LHSHEEVEMVLCEWLQMYDLSFHHYEAFKLLPAWYKYISDVRDMLKNSDNSIDC
jgi:hypothetical protein